MSDGENNKLLFTDSGFYRTTLCVSAVFAVAPYLSVRPLSLCLSVCLSVTFVHSIQTAEDIVKLLCRPGSAISLVFGPGANTQFQGEPLQWEQNTRGWENFEISTEIAVYLENGTR